MYQPAAHVETETPTLHALMRAHPLGLWVHHDEREGLVANLVPFLLDDQTGPLGTLIAHVARANPIWRLAASDREALVAFQGANAYITPSWYPTKHAHGKAVPTWNYVTVQARGRPVVHDDPTWLRAMVTRLTQTHEASQTVPWQVTDAPPDYIDQMIGAIVGIEIPITRLEGKWKVSQNRPAADRLGVVAGLDERGRTDDPAMADLVRRFIDPAR